MKAAACEQGEEVEAKANAASTTVSVTRALNELSRMNNQLTTLQRELAGTNARLRAVTEEKDRVLGMVVHDLRNPLSVLAANLSLLHQDRRVDVAPDVAELVDDMVSSTELMTMLLSDRAGAPAAPRPSVLESCRPAQLSTDLNPISIRGSLPPATARRNSLDSIGPRRRSWLEASKMAFGFPIPRRAHGARLESERRRHTRAA